MPASEPPRLIAYTISQLGTVAARSFSESVKEVGLTAPEAGLLRLLARSPGLSQRDLAQRLGAVPSRVVALLDSLEGKGLVVRRRSETDRRHHEVALTDDGTAMMRHLRGVATSHEAGFVGPLSEDELDELARLLRKLAAAHDLSPDVHPGYRSAQR